VLSPILSYNLQIITHALGPLGLLSLTSPRVPASQGHNNIIICVYGNSVNNSNLWCKITPLGINIYNTKVENTFNRFNVEAYITKHMQLQSRAMKHCYSISTWQSIIWCKWHILHNLCGSGVSNCFTLHTRHSQFPLTSRGESFCVFE
jgi:hypothetical protein